MRERKKPNREVTDELKPLFPRLWRYCVVLTGHPEQADDLAQAACQRALEKAHHYQPGIRLDRWVFHIAQRL